MTPYLILALCIIVPGWLILRRRKPEPRVFWGDFEKIHGRLPYGNDEIAK